MDVISAWTSPPLRNDHDEIQWKTAVPPANAKPARSAPPGRRMPKVTASASQMSPGSTDAVVSVNANEYIPSSAPPMPAIAADRANINTFDRLTLMPDAWAATSVLRTASAARPEADRITAWTTRVSTPNTTRKSRICSCNIVKSTLERCATSPVHSSLCTSKSFTQFTPGTSSDGARIDHPLWPLRISSTENGTSAKKNAAANVPSAKFTPPNRVNGRASSAPSAAAASAAITTAQKKLICPCETKPG